MKNFMLLVALSILLLSCKKYSKEYQEGKKNENILNEIDENKNNVVFLSFFPKMSFYTKDYLIEKELKNNDNLRTQKSKINEDFEDIIYDMKLLNSEFIVFLNEYSIILTQSLKQYDTFPVLPANTNEPKKHGKFNINPAHLTEIQGVFGTKTGAINTGVDVTDENNSSKYKLNRSALTAKSNRGIFGEDTGIRNVGEDVTDENNLPDDHYYKIQ